MRTRHFYHVYTAGAWARIAAEHAAALGAARFTGPVTVGLVGPGPARVQARDVITASFTANGLPAPDTWVEAGAGFEQVTLAALRGYAAGCAAEEAILYAHTKGAWNPSPLSESWRRSMTRHVVGDWRRCTRLVAGRYDTAGCHWVTAGQPNPAGFAVTTPVYAGNFWWARTGYLRGLPPPGTDTRHQAEEWIGLAAPRAFDLLPGWPSAELCATPEAKEAERLRVRRVLEWLGWFRGPAAELTCAHADGACQGEMRWVSMSGGCRDIQDFAPLCQRHSADKVSA